MSTNDRLSLLLQDTVGILNQHNISYWADCGTLLGLIRENQLLEWENDIDLGVMVNKGDSRQKECIESIFSNKGYVVRRFKDHTNVSKEGDDVYLDINYYYKLDDMAIKPACHPGTFGKVFYVLYEIMVNRYKIKETDNALKTRIIACIAAASRFIPSRVRTYMGNIFHAIYMKMPQKDITWRVPLDYFQTLRKIDYKGHQISVPADSEGYLSYRYGVDWMQPRRQWRTDVNDFSTKVPQKA